MVSPGSRVVDIGTDHAHIPMYLVESGKVEKALAADVNKGPLSIADQHIMEAGLSDRISTCLSDGLDKLMVNDQDSVVIAGMGGLLIRSILANDLLKAKIVKELILGPHSEVYELRRFLTENGMLIVDEKALVEDGKYYFLIKTCVGDSLISLEEDELRYGPLLLKRKDPVLKEYLRKQEVVLMKVKLGLNKQEATPEIEKRKKEIDEEMADINHCLKEYF